LPFFSLNSTDPHPLAFVIKVPVVCFLLLQAVYKKKTFLLLLIVREGYEKETKQKRSVAAGVKEKDRNKSTG